MIYENLLRPLLFRLDPETAHELSLSALRLAAKLGPANPLKQSLPTSPRTVMGLEFPNPIGLAAGLDKNGDCIDGLAALGFGFLEIGTVTPRPQPGNPRPRLFRVPEAGALVNRMGFNNSGVAHLIARVRQTRYRGILGINIGKNLTTPVERALDDYREGLKAVYPYAHYVTLNVSSPNTPGLRSLQFGALLDELLDGLMGEREELTAQHGKRVPLALKVAPDMDSREIKALAGAVVRHGVDAVIATNTTASRDGVEGLEHADEAGGLSGKPLFLRSTEVVARLADALQGRAPIIACGGVFSGADAVAKFEAGASLVQVYTGFIYRGPALLAEIGRVVAAL
ncbi:dihydroorotate dehydrogenase [Methylococcus capsulatus str. Bath]|jgi:dihydroorotate dehydrogenase|uniref:Dihydroorotate dehydrogenase (quinone) n=1 Tax=Methylococcus capsulatus (strain ATCC 33009 / NCIMB 11132 / Bath) TaxID=243233 RepID=PYRD_METCA|nr:RecName: Full=Dihydroorotate dehydrogenase (quinone); AltName: Full=DHOdehase; Short=DHOD; Short=DHODase; AltName: Full=Dihydroorotate oxidase [Methylococcus capsulatus str. Bath]AAU92481.1 dihydroorotate dehydrogenase [Methylococcus capsulatus str. Bath]